jgi:hypothetical protein
MILMDVDEFNEWLKENKKLLDKNSIKNMIEQCEKVDALLHIVVEKGRYKKSSELLKETMVLYDNWGEIQDDDSLSETQQKGSLRIICRHIREVVQYRFVFRRSLKGEEHKQLIKLEDFIHRKCASIKL